MRRVVVVASLLALVLPVAASAGNIDITNKFGTLFFNTAGLHSFGAQVQQFGTLTGNPIGFLKFSTGPCLSGCNASGIPTGSAVFSSAGSIFDVTCARKACGGVGAPLFTGSFTGIVTLTETGSNHQNLVFTLTGNIQGMLADGQTVSGTTTQTIFAASGQLSHGIAHIHSGSTQLTVPEPGTLGLMGTGLVGIAGMLRRKIFSV